MNTAEKERFIDRLRRFSPRRLTLAALGVLCVGLAAIGVVVPGLPTTIFLIMATYLFTRSCPWLEERLIRNRLFAPFLGYLDGSARMPLRAKITTMIVMWSFVGFSVWVLATTDQRRLERGEPLVRFPSFAALVVAVALDFPAAFSS